MQAFLISFKATSLKALSLHSCFFRLSTASHILAHVWRGHLEMGLLMSRHVVGCADNTCELMYINRQGAVFDPHSTDLDQRMFCVTQAHTCPRSDECSHTPPLHGKYPGQSTRQVVFLAQLVEVVQGRCRRSHPER